MKYTMQEAFDKAVAGMASQNWVGSYFGGRCKYRGPDGVKCAVGHLIPDEIAERHESWSADKIHELSITDLDWSKSANTRTDFLNELQLCHDTNHADPEAMKTAFRDFAGKYMLAIPKELA